MTMNRAFRIALLTLPAALAGCASYPYYGDDGVYYGTDYYDSYYGYGYYSSYPYYGYYPYSRYYFRNSYYYYPYYNPYYGYGDWDDDDRGGGNGQSASDELREITSGPGFAVPRRAGEPRVIRRLKREPAVPRRSRGSASRELGRLDFDTRGPAVRHRGAPAPRPQPRPSINRSPSVELRSIEPPRGRRERR